MAEIDLKVMAKIRELEDENWEVEKVEIGERYMGTRGDYTNGSRKPTTFNRGMNAPCLYSSISI